MYSLLVGFIITQILGIYYNITTSYNNRNSNNFSLVDRIFYSHEYGDTNWFGKLVFWNIGGFVLTIIIIIGVLPHSSHQYNNFTKTQYIENLADNSQVNGEFFLGSGHIGEKWKYTYYIKSNGAYYIKNIDADGIPIRMITSGKPRIEWSVKRDIGDYEWTFRDLDVVSKPTIFIPKGSIKNNYNLDASK